MRRVAAAGVDWLPIVVLAVAVMWLTRNRLCDGDPSVRDLGPQCGNSGAGTLGLWGYLACWWASVGYAVWNFGLRQGRTGSSVGKQLLRIRVVDVTTRAPVGFSRSVSRQLAHVLDVTSLGVGYLWPLGPQELDVRGQADVDGVPQRNALTPVSASPITSW